MTVATRCGHPCGATSYRGWRPAPFPSRGGFTLIELLVTISIAIILATVAVPSFQDFYRNTRMATISNDFIASLVLARSEAGRRGKNVALCKSSNGAACAGAGVNWEAGWIVFVNLDNDSPAAVDAGEPILRTYTALHSGYTLRPTANFTNFLSMRPSGESNNIGSFVLCENNAVANSRVIFVVRSGRPRLGADTNNNQIPEDENGVDIGTCTP
jgi:type IV fimbrial biogenesis protein FimT